MLLRIFSILIFLSFFSNICYPKICVLVSILPQRFFVKKIAKERAEVTVIVPPGYNPATYEPGPEKIKKVEKAKVYFAIGVPFEKVWLKRFSSLNRSLIIVHTEEGIKKRKIVYRWKKKEVIDPHIWLSPPLVKIQAKKIAETFIEIDPEGKDFYKKNLSYFIKQIEMLDREIELILKDEKGKEFLVFHPCWGYFAERYGLKQIPIELHGKRLSAKDLATLINYCRSKDIKTIFVQPQFPTKEAELIAKQIGAKLVFLDPLSENWDKNLLEVARKIKEAISF